MERSGQIGWALAAVVTLVIVETALVTGVWCSGARMERRIASLERSVRKIEAQDLEEAMEETARRIEALEDETGRLRLAGQKAARDEESASPTISDLFPDIDGLVDKKVKQEVAAAGAARLPHHPSMDYLATTLGLNQFQKQKTADVFNAAKYEAYQVMTTPREDGTTVLDDLGRALLDSESPRKEASKVFLKLLVDKVPGTDETYFSRLVAIRDSAIEEASAGMTGEQSASLEAMNVNVYAVNTGYSPLADFFRGILQKEK